MSQCFKRLSKANNQYCEEYDETKPSKFLTYMDQNNLYGYLMRQYLPTGGFRWLTPLEITNLDIEALTDEDDVGYVLEVDIEYPRTLNDKHNDLPFLCERGIPTGGKHPKLLHTLFDKKNYTIET